MRHFIRVFCAVAALALTGYGLIQPIEQDTRWLLALWLAAPPALIAARLSLPSQPRGISRSIQNLSLVIGIGFSMLALQLLRQQFVHADATYNWVYVDQQTGQSTSNVRPVIQSLRIQRGKMIDRNGTVLVDTQVAPGGFAVRTYPVADQFDPAAFGNVVGFFSPRYSQSGLEATYSGYLSGENDPLGRTQDALFGRPQVGDNLQLTIDARLQDAAMRIMGGRTGSIVVLEPKTGAVLAMVSTPGFDPRDLASNPAADDSAADDARVEAYWNQLNSEGAGQPLLNRPTQGRYPPGSTFKTLTAISVLEHAQEGRPDQIDCPNERFPEEGAPPVVNAVNDLYLRTGDPTNLERVFAFSCNTAFAEYALRLGPDLLADTARNFDIFRPQDVPEVYRGFADLPTAPSQLYVDAGFLNSHAALAATGYGQGQLLVTPLQMAMIAGAIANDGRMMEPYLVERITRQDDSIVVARGPRVIRRAVSGSVAAQMRSNMRAAVEYGFGGAAQQVDPSVAQVGGKSGTAEHAPGATPHAWFIAIAPVQEPRYAVAVMVENGGEGSGVSAQIAGEVLAAAFSLEQ
jgi:peptidoglycan glycosyltransferase